MKSLKEYQEERAVIINNLKTPEFINHLKEACVTHFSTKVQNAFENTINSGGHLYYKIWSPSIRSGLKEVVLFETKNIYTYESFTNGIAKLPTNNDVVIQLKRTFEELGFKTNITEFNDLIIEE